MMQHTLKSAIQLEGKGLHTGVPTRVTIKPAPANSGIVFIRVDQNPPVVIPANLNHVGPDVGGGRQTSLENGSCAIRTTEHVMASLHGLGVDNAVIEIDADEVPGMDGSAKEFTEKISAAGLENQNIERQIIKVKEPMAFDTGKQTIMVFPNEGGLKLSYTLSYQHKDLKDQYYSTDITPAIFKEELCSARTFCLKDEALLLKAKGFGQGATLENTLVFENDQPIQNTLRFPNEACRHKVVDLLGDLYLLGKTLHAHVVACRTGHQHNFQMMKRLVETMNQSNSNSNNAPVYEDGEVVRDLDVNAIQKILPHRHPFLLVDKIVEMTAGHKAVGIKNVTINEHFFVGHFPGHPVMPGVLILEALAQVGGVLMLSRKENKNKIAYFMTIENAKFRQPVHPGDQLRLEAEVLKLRSRTGQCSGKAYVGDKLVCEAEVKFAIVEP